MGGTPILLSSNLTASLRSCKQRLFEVKFVDFFCFVFAKIDFQFFRCTDLWGTGQFQQYSFECAAGGYTTSFVSIFDENM